MTTYFIGWYFPSPIHQLSCSWLYSLLLYRGTWIIRRTPRERQAVFLPSSPSSLLFHLFHLFLPSPHPNLFFDSSINLLSLALTCGPSLIFFFFFFFFLLLLLLLLSALISLSMLISQCNAFREALNRAALSNVSGKVSISFNVHCPALHYIHKKKVYVVFALF